MKQHFTLFLVLVVLHLFAKNNNELDERQKERHEDVTENIDQRHDRGVVDKAEDVGDKHNINNEHQDERQEDRQDDRRKR
jgi:hypothetical protein